MKVSSSFNTLAVPIDLKWAAFKSWSPLLCAAESGISSIGIRSASNSNIAFDPARDTAKVDAANKCGKSICYIFKLFVPLEFLEVIYLYFLFRKDE